MSSLKLWQLSEALSQLLCQAGHCISTSYFSAFHRRNFCGSLRSSWSLLKSPAWVLIGLSWRENSNHDLELVGDVLSSYQLMGGELSCLSWRPWFVFLTRNTPDRSWTSGETSDCEGMSGSRREYERVKYVGGRVRGNKQYLVVTCWRICRWGRRVMGVSEWCRAHQSRDPDDWIRTVFQQENRESETKTKLQKI